MKRCNNLQAYYAGKHNKDTVSENVSILLWITASVSAFAYAICICTCLNVSASQSIIVFVAVSLTDEVTL